MKKALLSLWVLCALLLFPVTAAATAVETARPSSLTVIYRDGEQAFAGLEIKTYRIAEVSAEGEYSLWGDFSDYPVSLYDVRSQAEWKLIATTLASYAVADGIAPTAVGITDGAGAVKHEGLLPGMYLTLSVKSEGGERITVFESFLTAIPMPAGDGSYSYDVTAYPKNTAHTPTPGEISHKVIKQWKDNGHQAKRPAEVKVDLYKDGVFQKTVSLSDGNNWMYEWTAADDGSQWSAVEREIPDGYKVTVTEQGNTLILTNVYLDGGIDPPQTGDIFPLELYIMAICAAGFLMILLSLWKMRAQA